MKKLILILLLLFVCACSNGANNSDKQVAKEEFIEPVEQKDAFEFLNNEAQTVLKSANSNNALSNKALINMGQSLPDVSLTTVENELIDLNTYQDKKIIIEVVSVYCSHCREQAYMFNDEILDKLDDVTFIEYFIDGDIDSIKAFYKEINKDIDNRILAVVKNDDFNNYIKVTLDVDVTPTFLFYNNNSLTFYKEGTTDIEAFDNLYDVALNNGFDLSNLIDEDGNSIFTHIRTIDDVINDLSADNYNALEQLDNDDSTVTLTLNNMGTKFDFYSQYSDESTFTSEVEFSSYANCDLMIVRVSEYNEEIFDILNAFYKDNNDVELVVVNMSDEDNEKMADKLDMPLCSILNQIPKKLDEENLGNSPACIFVKQGIITGIYSNINTLDNLIIAKNLFLTDSSIALVKNNQ